MDLYDTVVVGAGMAGLTAACCAARKGERTLLLEKADRPGKKILASGNGRCNLMNRGPLRYYGDPAFARSVMGCDYLDRLTEFWHDLGIVFRYDAEGRGYPATFQSSTVLEALVAESSRAGVLLRTGSGVLDYTPSSSYGFNLRTDNAAAICCRRLILASGGLPQSKLGGNDWAWAGLNALGHRMIPARPALVSLKADRRAISGLAGIRVRCSIRLCRSGEEVFREKGEVLFTEDGLSGICAMQCARFLEGGSGEVFLDLAEDLFPDQNTLLEELRIRQHRFSSESPAELLRGICLPRMAFAVCKQAGFRMRGETNGMLREEQLEQLAARLRAYCVPIAGTDGFERAQVMAGGLDCGQIRPDNLESRLIPGLHAAGELLNVDGDCGGYNLMFACMCGIRSGNNERGEPD